MPPGESRTSRGGAVAKVCVATMWAATIPKAVGFMMGPPGVRESGGGTDVMGPVLEAMNETVQLFPADN